jgi:non-heme chloroperoxidase
MIHPTRREILIGGAAVVAIATTNPSVLATSLNALPLPDSQGEFLMSAITTKDGVNIFYKDWGPKNAQPIMFHHGWPLSADDWDVQMLFFLANGYRVVAHDRRGHPCHH